MQIKDWLNHYDNAATQAKPITANKGVEKLTSSIEGLSKGNIFEGTVSSVKGGKVTLALSNGQTISARLEGKMQLQQGQSMFFQVKSNNGTLVEIRPYVVEGSGNPTLLQALKAANLPVNTEFISMVNKMMEEKMPIDKASVSAMARLVQGNVDINVETLVQLEKLGLPVNKETAFQFENYMNDRQAISTEMELFMDEIPQVMTDDNLNTEQLKNMGQQIISIVTEGLEVMPEGSSLIINTQEYSDDMYVNTLDFEEAVIPESMQDGEQMTTPETFQEGEPVTTSEAMQGAVQEGEPVTTPEAFQGNVQEEVITVKNTLGSVLTETGMKELSNLIKETFPMLKLQNDTSVVSVLNEIAKQINENPQIDKEQIIKLFSSDGFKTMIKDSLMQKWMITPQEVAQKAKMDSLYNEVKDQIEKLEHVIKENGATGSSITTTANLIKSNVEFMNQINQAYTYIQMPLKMSGQNASGQLYVYTNKKSLKDKDEELSAFLHLDMEHLGATDVSIKMLKKNVTTNFYFENDAAFDLIEQFLPMLEERLKNKGYNCNFHIENEKKHVNFVDDFLKKDQPSAGKLRRYSFDMRA